MLITIEKTHSRQSFPKKKRRRRTLVLLKLVILKMPTKLPRKHLTVLRLMTTKEEELLHPPETL